MCDGKKVYHFSSITGKDIHERFPEKRTSRLSTDSRSVGAPMGILIYSSMASSNTKTGGLEEVFFCK